MKTKRTEIKEQPILDKKGFAENICRQYSATYPIRTVYGETRKNKLVHEIGTMERRFYCDESDEQFLKEGVSGIIKSKEDAQQVASALARLRYGANHTLYHDLGVGINTVLTRPNDPSHFYDVRHLYTDEGKIAKTYVTISLEGIVKLSLGPLVNNKGRAIAGATETVKKQKRLLLDLVVGKKPEPFAMASITKGNINAAIYGKPLSVDRIYGDAVRIVLDNQFFPIAKTDGGNGLIMKELQIHHVAGLSSVISFGRKLMKDRYSISSLPKAPNMHKAILYMQTASEMVKFAPQIIQERKGDEVELCFRKDHTVNDLRPEAVNGNGDVSFPGFINFMNNTGKVYNEALEELGIYDHLHDDTLIPLTNKSAYFPSEKNKKHLLYIKAIKAKKKKKKK